MPGRVRSHIHVARVGGPYGVTRGLLEKFGPERVRDTPISEPLLVGLGTGAAAVGRGAGASERNINRSARNATPGREPISVLPAGSASVLTSVVALLGRPTPPDPAAMSPFDSYACGCLPPRSGSSSRCRWGRVARRRCCSSSAR